LPEGVLVKRARFTNCRIGILLSVFDRKEPRELGCHEFVNELSLHCFARNELRRQRANPDYGGSEPSVHSADVWLDCRRCMRENDIAQTFA
jgi:hypothetical protein